MANPTGESVSAGIPRMNTEQMRMVAAFWIAKKLGPEVGRIPGIPGAANNVRGTDLAVFLGISDTLLPSVALERMTIERLMLALVVAAAAVPQ